MKKRNFYVKLLMSMLLMTLTAPLAHADELTVYEGTSTSNFVPIYGTWADAYQKSEMIYDAAVLSTIEAGSEITGLTWYTQSAPTGGYGNAKFQIFMKEISQTTLSAYQGTDGATIVYEGAIDPTSSDLKVTVDFETPYTYNGGILLVGVYEIQKGSYSGTTFVGASGTSISGHNSSSLASVGVNQRYFVPKTTFTYESATPVDYKASVSHNAIDFGKLAPNTSVSQTITIKNKGLNAITPALSGISAPFSTDYSSTTINSGEELTFNVAFNPTEIGAFNQTLVIDCGFTDGIFNVVVDGICAKEIVVADGTTTNDKLPVYGYNYDSYNQQNQFVYPASMMTSLVGKKLKSITFFPAESGSYKGINFYNGAVTFSLASVAEGSVTFTESGNTPQSPEGLTSVGTITMPSAPQQSLTEWTLTFDGDGFDYYGGDLLVDVTTLKGTWGTTHFYGTATDDYAGYSCTSSTAKTGQKFLPKVRFAYEDAVAQVTVIPNELTFGGESFVIGNTEAKTFKVNNTTNEDVNLILNDESGFFSIDAATVEAGSTGVTVNVTYAPTAAGSHEATVSVGDKTVTLTGTAVAPVISGTVTPAELTFETYENVAATEAITIENTGNTAFTPVFSGIEAPFSIAEATEIAAGQSKEFAVTYAPEEIGSHTGTLNVTIGEQTPIAVTLTGAATEAPLEITVAENGTAQSQPIPIEGTYLDTEGAYSQTIYNKDDINVLAGNNISKIKYYSATTFDAAKIGGTVLEIYLMETENDEMPIPEGAYSAQPLTFDGVSIGEYEIQGGETEMEFVLNTPFNYSGAKNLAIQVRVKTKSPQTPGYNYQPINWYGEGKTIRISYAGNVGSYNNGAKSFLPKTTFTYEKEEEPAAVEATLAQIEGAEGVVGTKYAITDEYLVAVENRDVDVDGTGYVYVWCKDNDNVTDRLAAADGVIDFMQQQGVQGDWDQSNWVVLRFKGDDQEARSLKNCKLTNVIGTYVDASNYMIDVESYEKGESAEYTPNVYCVANFNAANWGAAGVQQEGKDSDAPYYFFMTPKAQEVCEVTFAEWNGTAFTVPAASGFAQNTLTLGWTYNQNSDGTPMSQETVNLEEGKSYKFNAIVMRSASKGAINGGSVVYPTNLTGGTENDVPTAISTVGVNGMVESVKYYNVAGVESNEPFEGVNIVVTRYSDGSTTTTKVLK